MTRRSTRLLAAAVGVAPAALVAQATTGVITGRVTDRASGAPIAAAQIQVVGSQRGTTTGDNGSFRIAGVPAGSVQLRVLRIGFAAQTIPVTVVSGQTSAPVNIGLAASAVNLDVVTVTATGTTSRAREQGSNIATVSVQDQPLAAVQNFSQIIAGRAAGVTVVQSSGTTGTGARVRIRGANSLNQSNEPLLIIDGVRIDPSANSGTIGVGGQTISRLNDLKPEDIETFDILKGPAATGLYGTQAANGVIQITTRRGAAGRPQFNGYGDLGTVRNYETYPGNYTVYGKAGQNATAFAPGATLAPGYNGVGLYSGNSRCFLTAQAAGTCTVDSITSVQPLNVAGVSPIVDGHRDRIGGSVRGGGDVARYFLSSDGETEHGVFTTSRLTRRNFRANVDATPIQGLNLGVSAGYLSSILQLPQGDNNILGLIPNGELGGPIICSAATKCIAHNAAGAVTSVDSTSAGYYSGLLPSQLNQIQTYQNVNRFTTAFNGNFTPRGASWLTVTATAGADVNDRSDQQLYPQGVINTSVNALLGNRTLNNYTVATYTINGSAVARANPLPNLSAVTTAGVQYQRDNTNGNQAFGVGLLPGTASLAGTSQQFAVNEQNLFARTFGVLVQEQLGYRDRLFVTGSVRGDKNSAFGSNLGFVTYPSGQLSYVPSEEAWFPRNPLVNSIKLRAAYGQSGLRPGVFDALTYFNPTVASIATQNLGAFTTGNFGLSDLRPERINEAEGGFDLGLLGGRVSFEATYFAKASRDALVAVPLPGSSGGPASQLTNIGRVTNKGVELSSTVNAIDQRDVALSAVFNFSTLANKLVALRPGLGETVFGLGGNTQRFSPGYPLGAYFQPKYTYSDANGDGVIQPSEVVVSTDLSAAGQYLGNPLPKHTFSVQPTLTLLRNIRVTALVDYRGGFLLYNGTEQFRCVTTAVCPENFVKGSPLEDQAASVAARSYGTVAGYITPAAFTKLRELSVNLGLPATYAQRYLHVRGASLNLAGRNLHTWTGYKGVDPEVNFAGQSNFTQADFLTLPPVRYYIARINLDF